MAQRTKVSVCISLEFSVVPSCGYTPHRHNLRFSIMKNNSYRMHRDHRGDLLRTLCGSNVYAMEIAVYAGCRV